MGSSYFYLEFLLAFLHLLTPTFHNPALLALEYSLVPDASYPTQLQQALAGYRFALSKARFASRICLAGDSAGATLMLSLLLHLADNSPNDDEMETMKPGFAVLISPWVTLVTGKHRNTESDYLDVRVLHRYGRQYAGTKAALHDAIVSPGCCGDVGWWKRASPSGGIFVVYGKEELLAGDVEDWIGMLREKGMSVDERCEEGGIHAWPVASLFLSSSGKERLKGLRDIAEVISERMG